MYDMVLDVAFPLEDKRRARSLYTRKSAGSLSQGLACASVLPSVLSAEIGTIVSESRSICFAPTSLGVLLLLVFALGVGAGLGFFAKRTRWDAKGSRRKERARSPPRERHILSRPAQMDHWPEQVAVTAGSRAHVFHVGECATLKRMKRPIKKSESYRMCRDCEHCMSNLADLGGRTRVDFFRTLAGVISADVVGRLPRETGACATEVLSTELSLPLHWYILLMIGSLGAVYSIYSLLRSTTVPQQRFTVTLRSKFLSVCIYLWNLVFIVVHNCSLLLCILGNGFFFRSSR